MKIKETVFFPHPVLRDTNNDYLSSKFETILASKNLMTKYFINLTIELNNKELLYLIESKKAKIICHIECSRTKFRDILKLNLGENEFAINSGEIEGLVYILPLIIANENIQDYYSKDFNKDYNKMSFNLEKGDILAIGKHFLINIENEIDKLSTVPSIFLIQKSKVFQDYISVGLSNEKIDLYLPDDVFKIYQKYRKNKIYNDLMCSVIILPSLMYVLDILKEEDDNLISFRERRWFRVIIKKLKEKGIDFEGGDLLEKDTFKVAQDLLDYLNSKSIISLDDFKNMEEAEE